MNKADLILKGNHVFKGEKFEVSLGFVAVKDNVIIGTGDGDNMSEYMKQDTKVIDCQNGFIMPGFHDCHVHIIQGGIFENGVNLADCKSEAEAAERVREYAKENPGLPWILGSGWYHIYWENQEYPTRESLDNCVADRPVYLENEDGHGAWVNSKALEICGITKETVDPDYGKIFRDANGEPTGYLDELAMLLCAVKAYDMPHALERKLFDDFISKAVKNGVTSVNDMRPFFTMDVGKLEIYEELNKDDLQPVRINFTSNLFGDMKAAAALKNKYFGGKLHYFGAKQFVDGVAISYTSLLIDEYSDKKGFNGVMLLPKEKLEDAILDAQENGVQVHLHVTGDAAVSLSLDAFEKAREKFGNKDIRHSLEHIDLIHPKDINRLSEMNIVASMQPEHMAPTSAFADNPYPVRFGKERSLYTWAIGSILNSGATVAFGTDFPVAELNPMNGIYRAVTRRSDDGNPPEGWNPAEKISLAQALGAYTLGSAKMVNREHELGTIEVGKLADIAVLNKSPFETDVDELRDIQVMMTICDGKVVYTENKFI